MGERRYGKGRVVDAVSIEEAIPAIRTLSGLPGCRRPAGRDGRASRLRGRHVSSLHAPARRRHGHLLRRQRLASRGRGRLHFRVSGKAPRYGIRLPAKFARPRPSRSGTSARPCPLKFDPSGSLFVVFRIPTDVTRSRAGTSPILSRSRRSAGLGPSRSIPNGEDRNPCGSTTLVDWTKRSEEGIRHYSGKAVYRKTFALATEPKVRRTFLNLGEVKDMAEVRLNGRRLGVVWCPPWRIEITDAVRPGANDLEVAVANLWVNRLIGDAGLPPEKRLAWTTWNPYKADSPLLESGLLGPVRLERTK